MKMYRSLGVILSLLAVIFVSNKYIDGKSFSEIADNSSSSKNEISYNLDDTSFTNESKSKENIITYKNEYKYSLTLNESNIKIKCNGSGENKEDDEALVEKNIKIKVLYSKDKIHKYESIKIDKDETVYIYISNQYEGTYPTNEVSCSYSINIDAAI